MAVNTAWIGRQTKVKQIGTFTVTMADVTSKFQLRIPDASGAYIQVGDATLTTATLTAAALVAAWNLAGGPFGRFTASNLAGVITLTSKNAGEPITVVSAVVGGAGAFGSASLTSVVANTSPNDFNDAVNFSAAATPAAGDTLVFDNIAVDALYNLDTNTSAIAAMLVYGTFQATVGLPKRNANGGYTEYRGRYITLKSTVTTIGQPDGSGSNLFMHNNGATAGTWNVYATGSNPESGIPAVLLLGTSASNVLNQAGGSVGIAYFANEVSNFSGGINITGGSCVCGAGVTLSGIGQSDGALDTTSALGTVTQKGGSHVHRAGNITALNLHSGTFELRAVAALTITDLTIGPAGDRKSVV